MLVKRSFSLSGHRTSVALEAPFWAALDAMAARRGLTIAHPLASLLRVTALQHAHNNTPPGAIIEAPLT